MKRFCNNIGNHSLAYLAAVVVFIAGCGPGPDVRYIFLSSTTHTGDFAQYDVTTNDGLTGADIVCQNLADASDLPAGTYKAWLSSDVHALDRLTHATVAYVRYDGAVIADNWDDLVDCPSGICLDVPISIDETGYEWPECDCPAGQVITGSDTNGVPDDYEGMCEDWSNATGTGTSGVFHVGSLHKVDHEWTSIMWGGGPFDTSCALLRHLYCIQQ